MSPPTLTANLEFARKLIEHCCWEDERVWRLAIDSLRDEQFAREVGFGMGSIERECVYIMETEWSTLRRLSGQFSPDTAKREIALDRAAMFVRWRAIHADWAAYMAELDAELFFSDWSFDIGGREVKLKVWQLIFDLVYQGSAHRADIMRMVADVAEAPQFDLSLMQFLSGVFRQ